MLNSSQFRTLIVAPALFDLQSYSPVAEELMMFTCAVESNGGSYLKQIKGPALGIYQMEPTTYNDIWSRYLISKKDLLLMLLHNFGINNMPPEDKLIYDLRYATAMTRIHYLRVKAPLPSYADANSLWEYYKTYYNTSIGAATKDASIAKYKAFIAT